MRVLICLIEDHDDPLKCFAESPEGIVFIVMYL